MRRGGILVIHPFGLACKCYFPLTRPKDTPFEDGTFKLTMHFSEEYPNKPPVVRFVSKMFHPNGNLPHQRHPGCTHSDCTSLCHYVTLTPSLSPLSLPLPPSLSLSSLSPSAVYADGSICLDILQNRWSPTYDVSSILTSIQV